MRIADIDPGTITGIDGMPADETADLLARLRAHAIRPENIYEHDWAPGDLVLWDNAVALHRRESFPETTHRLIKRMIITLDSEHHIIPPVIYSARFSHYVGAESDPAGRPGLKKECPS